MKAFQLLKKTLIFLILLSLSIGSPRVYAQSSDIKDINVNASINPCLLYLTVKPEKRIPPLNNWDTGIDMDVYNTNSTLLFSLTTSTNNLGKSTIDLCDQSIAVSPGNYNFYIKGTSTLRKLYPNVPAFSSYETFTDFSANGSFLLAGETSNTFDNYINSLDLSTQIKTIYTNDYKNDLNQDGVVNGLDLSITINNFFKKGD
jgi:hypothetical protein